jgi:hypothetical protein
MVHTESLCTVASNNHTAPTPEETCVCVCLKGSERGHDLLQSLTTAFD